MQNKESNASPGNEIDASDGTSVDSGNNLNWRFQMGGPGGGVGYPAIY